MAESINRLHRLDAVLRLFGLSVLQLQYRG